MRDSTVYGLSAEKEDLHVRQQLSLPLATIFSWNRIVILTNILLVTTIVLSLGLVSSAGRLENQEDLELTSSMEDE